MNENKLKINLLLVVVLGVIACLCVLFLTVVAIPNTLEYLKAMNENEKILLVVVLGVIDCLSFWFLTAVAIPNTLEKIYMMNQLKYVEKIRFPRYKRWFKWYINVRRRSLNNKTEVRLVELSETSQAHREMLMLYDANLYRQAAEKYVKIFLKPETYELFKSREVRFYHELDVVIKKAADGDELSQKFLLEYAEEGRRFSDDQITTLTANEKLKHIFRRYCENYSFIGGSAEMRLVELSPNDEAFYKVLSKYISGKKSSSPKKIAYKAEIELFRHKELFDIQVEYIKITGKCPPWESFQLLVNHAKDEKRYKELLLNLFDITLDPSDELVEYAIDSNDEDFLRKLNVFIGKTNKGNAAERNGLNERQQIMLSKAYNKNGLYRTCLETQIEIHGLCEKAKCILSLGREKNKVPLF